MVHLCKPAYTREGAITDKTGGCNNEASVLEIMFAQAPEVSTDGNASGQRVTGGADLNTKPTCQLVWERVVYIVRRVAPKGVYAMLMVNGFTAM